jgi:hypothetical protein
MLTLDRRHLSSPHETHETQSEAQRPPPRIDHPKSESDGPRKQGEWEKWQGHKRAHGDTTDTGEDDREEDPILLHTLECYFDNLLFQLLECFEETLGTAK